MRGRPILWVVVIVVLIASTAAAAGTLQVATATGARGEQVRIPLTVESPTRVAGYQVNLTFDPQVVQVVRIEAGDFDVPVANVNNTAGWAFFTQARARGIKDPTLAVMVFNVTGFAGTSTDLEVVVADSSVNDERGEPIPVKIDNGSVRVGTATATPTATATATDTPATTESPTPTATATRTTTTASGGTGTRTTTRTARPTATTATTRTATTQTAATGTTSPLTATGPTSTRTPIKIDSTTMSPPPTTTVQSSSQPGFLLTGAVLAIGLFVLYRYRRR